MRGGKMEGEVRERGLSSIAEMSELCNKNRSVISFWFKKNKVLFDVVLDGCVLKKNKKT